MEDKVNEEAAPEQTEEKERPQLRRSLLSLLLPPEPQMVRQARVLAGDRNFRITKLASLVGEDPVIVLELLRVANAAFYSADRPAITHVQTAVVRLGSSFVIQLLNTLESRPPIADPEVSQAFEALRVLSGRTALVGRIIAQIAQPQITDIAETASLLTNFGQMLACYYLGKTFVEESRSRKRSALLYRFIQEYHLDLTAVQLAYLRKNGVPNLVFYALDRELKCKTSTQSALRLIVDSAIELIDAYRDERWDRYSPDRELPAHSALRMLSLTSYQYQQIFDIVDAYLSERSSVPPTELNLGQEYRPSEVMLLDEDTEEEEDNAELQDPTTLVLRKGGFTPASRLRLPVFIPGGEAPVKVPQIPLDEPPLTEVLQLESLKENSKKLVKSIIDLCEQCQNSQDLLARILLTLVNDGMFSRAALISLNPLQAQAEVHTAVGEGFSQDGIIAVNDPLSPLALCHTKIQSFNSQNSEDSVSPFGVTAYAISPINASHSSPVVLYADRGLTLPLPMEARKVFRQVVELLNRTLPRLKGGLPKRAIHNISPNPRG